MNVIDGLERIRMRLETNQARTETLDVVDEFLEQRAGSGPTTRRRARWVNSSRC